MEDRTYYIDGTDWQQEVKSTPVRLYSSMEEIEEMLSCTEQCGVLELKISARWIKQQTLE